MSSVAKDSPKNTTPASTKGVAGPVVKYFLARIGLLIAVTLLLGLVSSLVGAVVPISVLVVLALIIAMPLSIFVFPRLQANANEAMARWSANRKAHKDYIRYELAGREEG